MLQARRKLGKYRIVSRLGEGGFAEVYKAIDTVESVPVALKVPYPHMVTPQALEDFRKEVRLTAGLDHYNILPIKNAEFVDGRLVVAYPLAQSTLAQRLRKRLSLARALDFGEQMISALAYAHERRIIHCDVKPENLLLFAGNRLRLTDFGISKVARRTMNHASGSGTVGYVAPEQAMGKPSFRSDVFSAGVILYQMLTGELPEWPYRWPLPGHERLKRKLPPEFVSFLRRCLEVDARKRYPDAGRMLAAYRRLLPRVRRAATLRRRRPQTTTQRLDWRQIRIRQFQREFKGALKLNARCERCAGPVAAPMIACPWCGLARKRHDGRVGFPARCPRCRRGRKLDWRHCAWCYGPPFRDVSEREYSDVRYQGRCANPSCPRKALMPYSRYCPWCRKKVEKPWRLPNSKARCRRCRWGIAKGFWDYCPWCARAIESR